jgi:hypothetical protein
MHGFRSFSKIKKLTYFLAVFISSVSIQILPVGPVWIPHEDRCPFYKAIKENDVAFLKKALKKYKTVARFGSSVGIDSPIHVALEYKSHDVLRTLLKVPGTDPNITHEPNGSFPCGRWMKPLPLTVAFENDDKIAADILLTHPHIDVNQALVDLMKPCWHCVGGAEGEANRIAGIKKLLAHPNVDIMKSDKDGKILLDYVIWSLLASGNGYDRCALYMKMIELLLEKKSMDSLSLQKAHIDILAWLARSVDVLKDVPDIKKQREVIESVAAKIKQAMDSVVK